MRGLLKENGPANDRFGLAYKGPPCVGITQKFGAVRQDLHLRQTRTHAQHVVRNALTYIYEQYAHGGVFSEPSFLHLLFFVPFTGDLTWTIAGSSELL